MFIQESKPCFQKKEEKNQHLKSDVNSNVSIDLSVFSSFSEDRFVSSVDSSLPSPMIKAPINPVNAKNLSHRIFRHTYGVLNEVYLQNFFAWMSCKSRDESNETT